MLPNVSVYSALAEAKAEADYIIRQSVGEIFIDEDAPIVDMVVEFLRWGQIMALDALCASPSLMPTVWRIARCAQMLRIPHLLDHLSAKYGVVREVLDEYGHPPNLTARMLCDVSQCTSSTYVTSRSARGTAFADTVIRGVHLQNVNFDRCEFANCSFLGCTFLKCSFREARFKGVDIRANRLADCTFDGSHIDGSIITHVTASSFRNCTVINSEIESGPECVYEGSTIVSGSKIV
jgi:hypothetical protein